MRSPATIQSIDLGGRGPLDVFADWPERAYLAALISSPGPARWSRWSILARPDHIVDFGFSEPDPIARLAELAESTRVDRPSGAGQVPFVGGWLVALSYELGRVVEPTARVRAERVDPAWPAAVVAWRCPAALVHDGAEGRWMRVQSGAEGEHRALPTSFGISARPRVGMQFGEVQGLERSAAFEASVARAVEYIHAGDVFEVNLAHRLSAAFSGSTRELLLALTREAGPWYGAYLEHRAMGRSRAAVSISPELFLSYDAASRLVVTRPIKGTRPASGSAQELEDSLKDQAELNMIVDLMRNDLGRVARLGSVRVEQPRVIERHGGGGVGGGGVFQGVATVRATLGRERGLVDLLRACVPGGSITGAPKVRAMQIIEELEPDARGLYTGAIGYISDCGNVGLNIAIRTCVVDGPSPGENGPPGVVEGGELSYGVGAGIVADSHPRAEWLETIDKAGALLGLIQRLKSGSTR